MFARLFAVASLASLAVASPGAPDARDQCNTGPVNCCNNVQQANDTSSLLGLSGLSDVLAGVAGQVAFDCSSVIGIAGNSCTQQPVCCNDNRFNGLIQTGCTPINANF